MEYSYTNDQQIPRRRIETVEEFLTHLNAPASSRGQYRDGYPDLSEEVLDYIRESNLVPRLPLPPRTRIPIYRRARVLSIPRVQTRIVWRRPIILVLRIGRVIIFIQIRQHGRYVGPSFM
jgi:hypothetical protein